MILRLQGRLTLRLNEGCAYSGLLMRKGGYFIVSATTVTRSDPLPVDRSRALECYPPCLLWLFIVIRSTTCSYSHGNFRISAHGNLPIDSKNRLPDPDGKSQLVRHHEQSLGTLHQQDAPSAGILHTAVLQPSRYPSQRAELSLAGGRDSF